MSDSLRLALSVQEEGNRQFYELERQAYDIDSYLGCMVGEILTAYAGGNAASILAWAAHYINHSGVAIPTITGIKRFLEMGAELVERDVARDNEKVASERKEENP